MSTTNSPVALATYFTFSIDSPSGLSLGTWDKLQGLGVTISESQSTGGIGVAMTQLPGRFKYSNIQLTRTLCAASNAVMKWINSFANSPASPTTAVLTSFDPQTSSVVMTWNLYGVVPVQWTGPSFDVESNGLATETLELAYQGFLP